jgi:2-methylcitrate dehydratase PrpD
MGGAAVIMKTVRRKTDITVPHALAFAFAIGACSWCFNTLQGALGSEAAGEVQKNARDREIDSLTHRIELLEKDAYDRGCEHGR